MSPNEQGNAEPGPEALAYGEWLKAIFLRQRESQANVARAIFMDPPQLSRSFSAKNRTIATEQQADALVALVRERGGVVSDADVAKLHRLRRAAQAVALKDADRVAALQEEMREVKALLGTFQGQMVTLEGVNKRLAGANSRLEERVNLLLQRVQEEEERADRERRLRVGEQSLHEQAEERAQRAEWGAEEASVRLGEVERRRGEAEERALRAEREAEEATAAWSAARKQLSAASTYASKSDADLEAQQEELRLLRAEVATLRRQVKALSGERPNGAVEKPSDAVSGPVVQPATQVKAIEVRPEPDDQRLREAVEAWVLSTADQGSEPEDPESVSGGSDAQRAAKADSKLSTRADEQSQEQKPVPSGAPGSAAAGQGVDEVRRRQQPRSSGGGRAAARRGPRTRDEVASRTYPRSRPNLPRPQGGGRAEARRARQQTGISGGGRAQQRREAERRRQARPFWQKASPHLCGLIISLLGVQIAGFLGLFAFSLMQQGNHISGMLLLALILFSVSCIFFVAAGAYKVAGARYAKLAAAATLAYFLLSLQNFHGITPDAFSEGAEKATIKLLKAEAERKSGR
ncbi:hypothetical protein ACWCQP_47455 [Streptomyces chartreusis]